MDRPTTRFTTTADGASIAWAEAGSGPPLFYVPIYSACHVELLPKLYEPVRTFSELIRAIWFDFRGTGLSQRPMLDVSYLTQLADLEAVVRAAGVSRMVLVGSTQTKSRPQVVAEIGGDYQDIDADNAAAKMSEEANDLDYSAATAKGTASATLTEPKEKEDED